MRVEAAYIAAHWAHVQFSCINEYGRPVETWRKYAFRSRYSHIVNDCWYIDDISHERMYQMVAERCLTLIQAQGIITENEAGYMLALIG